MKLNNIIGHVKAKFFFCLPLTDVNQIKWTVRSLVPVSVVLCVPDIQEL